MGYNKEAILLTNSLTDIANKMMPNNLRKI